MIDRTALKIRHRKGLKICKWYAEMYGQLSPYDITDERIGKAGTTPCRCSCFMCGNPRKHFKGKEKLTIQELVQIEKEQAEY